MNAPIFRGLSAFPLTPTDAEGVVDTDALAIMIDRLATSGVDSVAVLGSTGAYAYLDPEQRRRALATAVETLAGRVPLIAGIGAMRTSWVCDLARDAERQGADGVLLAPVSYAPLTQDEVFLHFEAAAGASGLPICVYNNPGTTHFTFTPELLTRLSNLPRVAAIKMPLPSNGDFAGELDRIRFDSREGTIVGYSGDWGAAPALMAGADAWYSVIAGLLPEPALRLTRAAMSGDANAAAAADEALAPMWALFKKYGSLRVMYSIARHLGLKAGSPPLPVQPLDEVADGAVDLALLDIDA